MPIGPVVPTANPLQTNQARQSDHLSTTSEEYLSVKLEKYRVHDSCASVHLICKHLCKGTNHVRRKTSPASDVTSLVGKRPQQPENHRRRGG